MCFPIETPRCLRDEKVAMFVSKSSRCEVVICCVRDRDEIWRWLKKVIAMVRVGNVRWVNLGRNWRGVVRVVPLKLMRSLIRCWVNASRMNDWMCDVVGMMRVLRPLIRCRTPHNKCSDTRASLVPAPVTNKVRTRCIYFRFRLSRRKASFHVSWGRRTNMISYTRPAHTAWVVLHNVSSVMQVRRGM